MILFFHCARTIFECLAFPGRVKALFHVCIVLCPAWALQSHRSNSASHIQSKCSISQGSLYVLQLSQSLLNYLLKPFLNRHCSFSSAVVNSLYLALPGCWDFQSCIPCRYLLFIVLNCAETQKAGARFTSSQPQFHHAMNSMVVQEQPGPFLQTSLSPCQAREGREEWAMPSEKYSSYWGRSEWQFCVEQEVARNSAAA